MTNSDFYREDFEKWAKTEFLNLNRSCLPGDVYVCTVTQGAWLGFQAATQATARRCVEMLDDVKETIFFIAPSSELIRAIEDYKNAISQEFGLQGE